MTLQGSLQLEHNGETFSLMVKTFLKHGIYYFFVSDKEKDNTLLGGETLELTFRDSFCTADGEHVADNKKIAPEKVSAVENMLLQNKSLWYY
ncbi:MAG: hypothetical protein ABIQ31_09575 [Ferruginibacter sp.]